MQLKETEEGLQFGKERGSIDDPISSTWASRNRVWTIIIARFGSNRTLIMHCRQVLLFLLWRGGA